MKNLICLESQILLGIVSFILLFVSPFNLKNHYTKRKQMQVEDPKHKKPYYIKLILSKRQ